MFSYISSYFFSEDDTEIIVSEEDKQKRYKMLKEIRTFDKTNLLCEKIILEEFIKDDKLFHYNIGSSNTQKKKRYRKRKQKKSSSS